MPGQDVVIAAIFIVRLEVLHRAVTCIACLPLHPVADNFAVCYIKIVSQREVVRLGGAGDDAANLPDQVVIVVGVSRPGAPAVIPVGIIRGRVLRRAGDLGCCVNVDGDFCRLGLLGNFVLCDGNFGIEGIATVFFVVIPVLRSVFIRIVIGIFIGAL